MPMPRGLLLDLDNTAYAYAPCHEAGLLAGWDAARAWYPNEADFRAAYGDARRRVKEQVGPRSAAVHCRLLYFKALVEDHRGRSDSAEAQRLHRAYWDGYFAAMTPDPGVVDFFETVQLPTAWVTNFTTERQVLKLAHLGLLDAADFLFTSEEAGAEKPDPALLQLALRRMNLRPDEVWHVGDSLREDGGMARAGGVRFVWFNRAGEDVPPGVDAVVRDWFELGKMLHD